MRKIVLFFFMLIPFLGISQELPYKDGDIVYELTVYNDSLSKDSIYSRTQDFLNNTLKKGSVYIQSNDFATGNIIARGVTSFNEKNKSWIKYEFGLGVWSRFKMSFDVSDNAATIKIFDIEIVKKNGIEEISKKLIDDAAEGKQYLSGLKEGKLKTKRQKEFQNNAEEINNTFYTVLALYKRQIQ